MFLEKVTPTHRAIAVLDTTIKTLKLQRDALAATLPEQKKQPPMTEMVHPITGRVFKVRKKNDHRSVKET